MDYEKAYKKAVEKLRYKITDNNGNIDYKEIVNVDELQDIFPELQESKDERIKRKLVELFTDMEWDDPLLHIYKLDKDNILAWLEKQSKQKPKKVSIWKHWKDGIAGNGEGEQIYLIKSGLRYSISSCLGYECDYIELSELDKLMVDEKKGEKTGAISADKELCEYIRNTCACIDDAMSSKSVVDINDYLEQARNDAYKAFEYMEKRMETPNGNEENNGKFPPKWSEEDDCYMSECISAIATKDGWSFEEKTKTKHWLQSLKQRMEE